MSQIKNTPPAESQIKSISPAEFRERGYLLEANRRFFHPLGLAMAVLVCLHDGSDGTPAHDPQKCPIPDGEWAPMWDYRDDPEGILFEEPFTDEERLRAQRINEEQASKINARLSLGCDAFGVQPLS